MKFKIYVSDKRAASIYKDIVTGSKPGGRFYAMVAASTAIATFGLIKDSTAIVIGAMLVAPLMTPIFGIALGLVRGGASLFGRSVRAEIIGVFVTIALGACLGLLIPELNATKEMLNRTSPNLLDLLVAVFAGFAGAYALVDEKLSPALPGVAIATAIVPPLANTGLCLSLGAYHGATGSFLLFFANFLSILLVASVVFYAAGMDRYFEKATKRDIFRRFGLAGLGFIAVAVLLSFSLSKMIQERRLTRNIDSILSEELSHLPATSLQKITHQAHEEKIYVLAHVHASGDIVPSRVGLMEKALEKKLESPVELFLRTTESKDISSTGSINQITTESLDGFFFGQDPDTRVQYMKVAEQTIREYLSTQIGLYVEHINLLPMEERFTILATVVGVRHLTSKEMSDLELEIQRRANTDALDLTFRHVDVSLYDRWGPVYWGWVSFENVTTEREAIIERTRDFLTTSFHKAGYALGDFHFTFRQGVYHVLVEVTGPEIFPKEKVSSLKKEVIKLAGLPVELYIRWKAEVVVTDKGYDSFSALQKRLQEQMDTLYREQINKMVEGTL